MARKEAGEKPVLHIYLELKKNGDRDANQVAAGIHKKLRDLDSDYADLEDMLGLKPLKITLLPEGTFQEYILEQQANGTCSVIPVPPHINPPDYILDALLDSFESKSESIVLK